MNQRRLVWFSCGAPSAVAAKLTVQEYPGPDTEVVYCDTGGEHPDNKRFLLDVQRWLGVAVKVLQSRYTDHFDVALKTGYIAGPSGARCTKELKRDLRQDYQRWNDIHVWGFTAEEQDRRESFEDRFSNLRSEFPLIDNGITRGDALALIDRQGIELPIMYQIGYKNNNCVGCWKGGMGYWNKIRVDFPFIFDYAAKICRKIGRSPIKDKHGKPVMLDELDPSAGRYEDETEIECGVTCELIDLKMRNAEQ